MAKKKNGRPKGSKNRVFEFRFPYVALDEDENDREVVNFFWESQDVRMFDLLWQDGDSLWDIADQFGRPFADVVVLFLDRALKGYLDSRVGGVMGNRATTSIGIPPKEFEQMQEEFLEIKKRVEGVA